MRRRTGSRMRNSPMTGGLRFAALALALTLLPPSAGAQDTHFLRIGTGGQSGTYFPIGSLIAQAITDVPRGPNCAAARCGVPGLVAVAQASNGSVANSVALQVGEIEAALVQADVAHWASEAKEIYAGKPRHDRMRFLAHLYSEAMHAVVRKSAGISGLGDLKGRVIALDEPGSGTLIHVRNLLGGHGLRETDVRGVYIKPELALPRMAEGQLDAFFIVAGWPAKAVRDAIDTGQAVLLPLEAGVAQALVRANPFLSAGQIPAGVYAGAPAIPTVMVGAHLIVRADLPDALVTAVLQALWSDRGMAILRAGHPRSADIRLEAALTGRSIPLHPAAETFYRQRGLPPS